VSSSDFYRWTLSGRRFIPTPMIPGSLSVPGRVGGAGLVRLSATQPEVVPADAAVGNASVAAGEPGDGPLDHGPVPAVSVPEGGVRGALTVLALQRVVFVEIELASPR
jgi:hypothetical protein